ncbi:uncharacterized protein LOC141913859 [Tubulanus polymorphus]|uniref:uncharacterized protein LOC141913859 n=1 Tax=Tubulanus polymorphus TaxID=672921 RepID=UPI003DA5D162
MAKEMEEFNLAEALFSKPPSQTANAVGGESESKIRRTGTVEKNAVNDEVSVPSQFPQNHGDSANKSSAECASVAKITLHSLAEQRRYELRPHINPRYRSICASKSVKESSEVLFGVDMANKVKELNDLSKVGAIFNKEYSQRDSKIQNYKMRPHLLAKRGPPAEIFLTSDASGIGWRGTRGNLKTGGNWSSWEAALHINQLEIEAALFTLQPLCKTETDTHILIRIDNQVTVAFLNNMGGRKEKCNAIARETWLWCKARGLWLTAAYLPGALNTEADAMSRTYHDNTEWGLNDRVFRKLCQIWGEPAIDLFASRNNHKVPRLFSWKPDPQAEAVDAFSVPWNKELVYAFPPFCLVGKTLQKIQAKSAQHSSYASVETDERATEDESFRGEDIGRTTTDGMFSQEGRVIITASWRESSRDQYSTQIRKWLGFCAPRNADPYEGSVPIVSRFMRGIFNLRPALPRNRVIWSVEPVLNFLKGLSPAVSLSLKDLTLKLVLLLALLTGQSLYLIDLRNITLTTNKLKIRFGDLLKQSRPRFHQAEITFKAYVPDRRLCIVNYCKVNLNRKEKLRGDTTQFFISYVKPHGPISRDTLSRWIRVMLTRAGVDMNIFTPHSTRSAATTAAERNNAPIQSTLKTAGWSNLSVFRKYYRKPVPDESNFNVI